MASPHPTARKGTQGIPGPEFRALQELASDVLGHLDLEGTLLSILNAATKHLSSDVAGILLTEGDGIRMRACTGHRTMATAHLWVEKGQGVAGQIYATGRPLRVNDYESDPAITRHFIEIVRQEAERSALGAPLIVDGDTIGALMVWRRRPSKYTDHDEQVAEMLAHLAATALVNAERFESERTHASTLALDKARVEEQLELLRFASEVHERLTALVLEGKTLQDVISVVSALTQRPVAAFDAGLRLLQHADGKPDSWPGLLQRAVRTAQEENREPIQSASIPPTRAGAPWLLVADVVAGGERIGYVLSQYEQEPGGRDRLVIEQAALVCALLLTKQRAVWEVEARLHSDLVWDLIDGSLSDSAEALLRASHLGQPLATPVRVICLEFPPSPSGAPRHPLQEKTSALEGPALALRIAALAREAGCSAALAARRGRRIALLVSGCADAVQARRVADYLARQLTSADPYLPVAIGVSEPAHPGRDVQSAYAQAERALSSLLRVHSAGAVALFDDLGILRFLLAPSDRHDLDSYVDKTIGPILRYDEAHGGDFLNTATAYLENDCNMTKTAAALFLHPKSVRYRLSRIEQIASLDLARQQGRFDLHLAVLIHRTLSTLTLK